MLSKRCPNLCPTFHERVPRRFAEYDFVVGNNQPSLFCRRDIKDHVTYGHAATRLARVGREDAIRQVVQGKGCIWAICAFDPALLQSHDLTFPPELTGESLGSSVVIFCPASHQISFRCLPNSRCNRLEAVPLARKGGQMLWEPRFRT